MVGLYKPSGWQEKAAGVPKSATGSRVVRVFCVSLQQGRDILFPLGPGLPHRLGQH